MTDKAAGLDFLSVIDEFFSPPSPETSLHVVISQDPAACCFMRSDITWKYASFGCR